MRKLAIILMLCCGVSLRMQAAEGSPPPKRILVLPYANGYSSPWDDAPTIGVAAFIVEVLRAAHRIDPSVEVVHGQLTLTPEQARLTAFIGQTRNVADMLALARKTGAHFILTGAISGPVRQRMIRTDIYPVTAAGFGPVSSSAVTLNLLTQVMGRSGGLVSTVSMQVFIAAGLAPTVNDAAMKSMALLPEAARKALAEPPTDQVRAFLLWSRALAATFGVGREGESPILAAGEADARQAAHVDPKFVAAQRLSALLIMRRADRVYDVAVREGRMLREIRGEYRTAREHLALAVKADKNDIPSLAALAHAELRLGNAVGAVLNLETATRLDGRDSALQAQLAKARFAAGHEVAGIAALEKARDLDGTDMAYRRLLAAKYANARRYADAVRELEFVVANDADVDAVFDLGANLRAIGNSDRAAAVYRTAAKAFTQPVASRFMTFAGDALSEAGNAKEAASAYEAARQSSGRVAIRRAVRDALVGKALKKEVSTVMALRAIFEKRRQEVHFAVNDVVTLLSDGGGAQCPAASRSFQAARAGYQEVAAIDAKINGAVRRFQEAVRTGEHMALTPDARDSLAKLVREVRETIPRAVRKARWAVDSSARTALERAGCLEDGQDGGAATADEVRSRNQQLGLSEADPKEAAQRQRELTWRRPYRISPHVRPSAGRLVRVIVDNSRCAEAAMLYVNKAIVGKIPAKGRLTASVAEGQGTLCVEAAGRSCKEAKAHRSALFSAGFVHVVVCFAK